MSNEALSLVWKAQIPPTQKLVLLSIADYANHAFEAWPSLRDIVNRTCLAKSTVQDALAKLECEGIVVATEQRRENGSLSSNLYKLNQDALLKLAIPPAGTPIYRQPVKGMPPAGTPSAGNRYPPLPGAGTPDPSSDPRKDPSKDRGDSGPLFEPELFAKELHRLMEILISSSSGKLIAQRDSKGKLIIDGNTQQRILNRLHQYKPDDGLLQRAGACMASEFWMGRGRKAVSLEWLFSKQENHFGELLSYATQQGSEGKSGGSDRALKDIA